MTILQGSTTVFIAAITSDIGRDLAFLYRQRGYSVLGTYRSTEHLGPLRDHDDIALIPCDVGDFDSIGRAADALRNLHEPWDLFIGAVGQLDPIGRFFDGDIADWKKSIVVNAVGQLALLHAIYPFRDTTRRPSKIAFLVGGGINGPFRNYSAYCLSKVMLVKFCELIDDEYPDVHAVAVGTGWVNTKIHQQTLHSQTNAGDNLRRTYEFLDSGQSGTPIADILGCIDWCFGAERTATGGRNFSVVHDHWKADDDSLAIALATDANMFKLRRKGG